MSDKDYRRVFDEAASIYQRALTDEIRVYLIEKRGLTQSTVDDFRIGFASGGLGKQLKSLGFDSDALRQCGLIKEDGRDFLYNHITIPYLEDGHVVTIRGRTLPNSETKAYYSLPGSKSRLFNVGSLRKAKGEALICEGEFDTMVATQNGLIAVGVPGAVHFKPEWGRLFRSGTVPYVAYDPDEAGSRGVGKLVEVLGPLVKFVKLPDGRDLNDFFLSGHTAADLRQLMAEASSWFDLEVDRILGLDETVRPPELRALLGHVAQVDQLIRPSLERRIADAFKLRIGPIREEVAQITTDRKRRVETAAKRQAAVEKPASELNEEALSHLKDTRLLRRFLDDCERIGLVGEDDNKLLLLLAFTSRISDSPINIIVKGESSGGKSHLVRKVQEFIPPEDVVELTGMSPKALLYRNDSLSHKIIVVCEFCGTEESEYFIRTFQSEGKLSYAVTVKNPETNRYETEDRVVEGPVGLIVTTTKLWLNPENETRNFELHIDETVSQTERIFEQQRKPYRGVQIRAESVVTLWQRAQQLLKNYPVRIPFIDHICFPKESVRTRRDHDRFLRLIAASCLLHQYQREKVTIDGTEYLEGTVFDYGVAYNLANKVLLQTLKNLSPGGEELLTKVRAFISGGDQAPSKSKVFTVPDIVEETGKPDRTVRRHLTECAKAGYLNIAESGRGRPTKYTYAGEPKLADSLLLSPDELARRIAEEESARSANAGQDPLASEVACEATG